jgi:hypothetical protein
MSQGAAVLDYDGDLFAPTSSPSPKRSASKPGGFHCNAKVSFSLSLSLSLSLCACVFLTVSLCCKRQGFRGRAARRGKVPPVPHAAVHLPGVLTHRGIVSLHRPRPKGESPSPPLPLSLPHYVSHCVSHCLSHCVSRTMTTRSSVLWARDIDTDQARADEPGWCLDEHMSGRNAAH